MEPSAPLTYARAKRMRREPTEAEQILWGALRNRRLGDLKFYRQKPIGPFIVDFINQEYGLVIEVDGVTHGEPAALAHDKKRTTYLAAQGLIVHRVDNLAVYHDLGAILDGIYAVVSERAAKGPHQSRCDSFSKGEATGVGVKILGQNSCFTAMALFDLHTVYFSMRNSPFEVLSGSTNLY